MLFDDLSLSSPADGDATDAPGIGLIDSAGAPAPEALSGAAIAAAVARELYECGREVRFALVPARGRVTVLLCDLDGAVMSHLTPAGALEIATGGPVPGVRRG